MSDKWNIKNQDLKIPYFYSIEFQKFFKIHQSHSDTKYMSDKWNIKN